MTKITDELRRIANQLDAEPTFSLWQRIDVQRLISGVLAREIPAGRMAWLHQRQLAAQIADKITEAIRDTDKFDPVIYEHETCGRVVVLKRPGLAYCEHCRCTTERLRPARVEAKTEPNKPVSETGRRRAVDVLHAIAVSMASFIAEIDDSSENVAAYIEQRLGLLIKGPGWMTAAELRLLETLEDIAKDTRPLQDLDAPCAWCSVARKHHSARHPFQAKKAHVPAAVQAAASADKAVIPPDARCPREWVAGVRCTKPADGHPPRDCVYVAPPVTITNAAPKASVLDAVRMPPEHDKPPPGFLPCTRPAPHTGPCAHPPEYGIGKAPWIGETLPDPLPNSSGMVRQHAVVCAVARAVRELELRNGLVPMTSHTFRALEKRTSELLTETTQLGDRAPTINIDCEGIADRAARTIRVNGLGVQIKYPPKVTDYDLWQAAKVGQSAADQIEKLNKPAPVASLDRPIPRCNGGCSRGGEGPACGKPGCSG